MRRPVSLLFVCVALLALSTPHTSSAAFHFSEIDEIMTSYGGDPNVQFLEIQMLLGSQGIVSGSQIGAFDTSGAFLGQVYSVTGNVGGGNQRRWLMGTSGFETTSGLTPDFIMSPGMPTVGGMVCWGKPINASDPAAYVDCIAYGTYSGPSNTHIGTPTSLAADGHSLRRISHANDSATDFECANPADPENNELGTVSMAATTTCPGAPVCGNEMLESGEECDGSDDDACPGECLGNCTCPPPAVPTLPRPLVGLGAALLVAAGLWTIRKQRARATG